MPTLASLNIPTPKSWEEFEDICLSSFKIRWSSPNLTKHGRQGQPQHGVDIYGEDNLGQFVGIQCKKFDVNLTLKAIEAEIEKVKKFEPSIKAFYIATSSSSDTKIQSAVRLLSSKRVILDEFPIGIFFWNDIIQDLANNEAVFSKHFPQLNIKSSNSQNGQKLIAVLDLVYYGTNFHQSMGLLFGETYEDPIQLSIICNVLESASLQILSEKKQQNLFSDLKYIEDYVLPWVQGKEDRPEKWAPAMAKVKTVETKIIGIQYQLANDELTVFQLAVALANWDRLILRDKIIKQADEDRIKKLIRKLVGKVPPELTAELKRHKTDISVSSVDCAFNAYRICKEYIIANQINL